MKIKYLLFLVNFFALNIVRAQFPLHVQEIKSIANQSVTIKGNLDRGSQLDNLSWAWNSAVACFPATQKQKFTGNHMLYYTHLPARAIMTITVIPNDVNQNFSLYAYQIGENNFSTVPDLHSCVSCEADYKWDYKKANKTQDHSRTVEMNSTTNSYNVVIGVVGANGLNSGEFSLIIKLKGGDETVYEQEAVKLIPIVTIKNAVSEFKGDLKDGVIINDLSWAWNSSVACFPETQASKFRGKHVLYVTELPANSQMEITVVPDDVNADYSLYAYQIGLNNNSVVPNLSSCISCEADHKWDRPKAGKNQDHTRTV